MVSTVIALLASIYLYSAGTDSGLNDSRYVRYICDGNVTYIGTDNEQNCSIIKEMLKNDNEKSLTYVVVNSGIIQRELMTSFLQEFKKYCRAKRISFRKITDYWSDIFDMPLQIFVFGCNDNTDEDIFEKFNNSSLCRDIAVKSLELRCRFWWMGTMTIIEDDVKKLLQVPESSHLIATIFFGNIESRQALREN